MLDVANYMLRLQAFHYRCHHLSSQNRIFAEVFESTSVARFAREIHAPAERHVVALSPQFAANQRSILISRLQVPTRRARHVGGQRR